MPFTFKKLSIPDVILIKPQLFHDERGFFAETYKEPDFIAHGITARFVQDNHSKSKGGVLRGLHFQNPPKPQGKLVRVVAGSVYDVAVDLRKNSPTFGKWVSATLTSENAEMLWVPPGFAHGVLVLEDNTHLLYKVTEVYSKDHDRALRFDDPTLGIKWPVTNPELSAKDLNAPFLHDLDCDF